MKRQSTFRSWLIYAMLLLALVGGSLFYLKKNNYVRSYLEGFIQDKYGKNDENTTWDKGTKKESMKDYGVVVCTFGEGSGDLSDVLPVLLDSILAHDPLAVGLDFDLGSMDVKEDSLLLSIIQSHDNVVVGYDLNQEFKSADGVYPFGLEYGDFLNIGYFNFGAKGTEARYLEPYRRYEGPVREYAGERRTAFWARLWEVAHGIPSGKLKSHRRFINYSFDEFNVESSEILGHELSPCDYDENYRNRIVIIGEETTLDMIPTPITYGGHYVLPGAMAVGYATATIGRNEVRGGWFDRNRIWAIVFLCLLFASLFTVMHFGKCRWLEKVRHYSNIIQFLAAIVLFIIAKDFIPPTADELWTYFAVLALFVLFAPVVGDLLKLIQSIWRKAVGK